MLHHGVGKYPILTVSGFLSVMPYSVKITSKKTAIIIVNRIIFLFFDIKLQTPLYFILLFKTMIIFWSMHNKYFFLIFLSRVGMLLLLEVVLVIVVIF